MFKHKKSLGQHFLNSDVVPGWLCDAAGDITNTTVLEIGPGAGALTKVLLERQATVFALEADSRAVRDLETRFAAELESEQLRLFHGDARSLDLTALGLVPHQFQVISNIPYYLTGHLFRTLLENPIQPNQLVFLVQYEVAKRACAQIQHGQKESLLSLSLQFFGEPDYVRRVSRNHFTPAPNVDSAIMAVRNIQSNEQRAIPADCMFRLLHAGFGQKRKQLQGNLRSLFSSEQVIHSLHTAGVPATIRAEDVSLEKWLIIAGELYPHVTPI